MKDPRRIGRKLTVRQAAKGLARQTREKLAARRFVGTVTSITDRETTGEVKVSSPATTGSFVSVVQVRANVDIAVDDYIWIREDQGAQGTFVFDGFVKGGGTGKNAADAPIPWTQSPGIVSPPGSDLAVEGASGQAVNVGAAGQTVNITGDIAGVNLDDLDDVNAAAPSDKEVLTWDNAASEWQAKTASGFLFTGVWTIGTNCDYATLAAAVAATPPAGTLLLLDAGTHAATNVTLPDSVHLGGFGVGVTTLQTSTHQNCLQIGDGSYIADLTIQNTYSAGTCFAVDMHTSGDDSTFERVKAVATNSTSGHAYAFRVYNATLIDCEADADSSANNGYGLIGRGTSTVKVRDGEYAGNGGTSTDIGTAAAGTEIHLYNPTLANGTINIGWSSGVVTGYWRDASDNHNARGPVSEGAQVTNSSGATVSAGAVGYIDEAGDFKTIATAYSDVPWAVVLSGGANAAEIYVTKKGRVTVTLNGNCSAGDYLYTSSTAGQAQPQSYIRPEVFAVALTANAGGAGGTCEALLLCNTRYVPITSSNYIFYVPNTTGTSRFSALIDDNAGAHGGTGLSATTVPYDTIAAGSETNIDPGATTQLAKIRLYNSTRGTYRLITGCDQANDVITTVSSTDAWADNDVIYIESNTIAHPSDLVLELEVTSSEIPELTRALQCQAWKRDTGAAGYYLGLHPYETFSTSKEAFQYNQEAAAVYNIAMVAIPLIQKRFGIRWNASGAGTATQVLSLIGAWVAEP